MVLVVVVVVVAVVVIVVVGGGVVVVVAFRWGTFSDVFAFIFNAFCMSAQQ